MEDWEGRVLGSERALLADGWCGVLCQVRGDWAFYQETFYVPSWQATGRMCFFCEATNRGHNLEWCNFANDAPWRDTCWNYREYLGHLRRHGLPIPVLFAVIGLTITCVMVDVLRCVDLGLASHILGNASWELIMRRGALGGRSQKETLERFQEGTDKFNKRTKNTSPLQGKLTIARLRQQHDWPRLQADGAMIRHLAPYLL